MRTQTCTRTDFAMQVIFDEKWDLMSYIGYLHDLDAVVVVFRYAAMGYLVGNATIMIEPLD